MGHSKSGFLEAREAEEMEAQQGQNYFQLSATVFSCAAICINEEIIVGDGKKVKRLVPGMEIMIANNELVNCTGQATHMIRECCKNFTGTRAKITASDLYTGKLTTIDFTA